MWKCRFDTFAWQLRIALRALQFKRFRLYQQRVVCKLVKFPFCWGSVTSSGDNINSLQRAVVTARDARCHDITMDLNEWYENAVNNGGCWESHRTGCESQLQTAPTCRTREYLNHSAYESTGWLRWFKLLRFIVKFGNVTLSVWVLTFRRTIPPPSSGWQRRFKRWYPPTALNSVIPHKTTVCRLLVESYWGSVIGQEGQLKINFVAGK